MKILERGETSQTANFARRAHSPRVGKPRLSHIAAFHAYQSAEKYLKGLLVASEEEPPRIHALPGLLRQAVAFIPDLDGQELRDAAINLNGYYIPSRYPAEVGGASGPITTSEANEALNWAEAIADEIRPRLESR